MNWHKAYFKAIELAAIAHNGVNRKYSAEPYFVHPLRVSEVVLDYTGSFELACAAVLHDTLEDTAMRPETISNNFPDNVRALVESVTKNKALPKPEREAEYLERFRTSPIDTVIIKLADRYDNIRDLVYPPNATPNHFKIGYVKNTTGLLRAIPEYAKDNQVVKLLQSEIINMITEARELATWPVEARI